MPCWITEVDDSALLAGQANKWFSLSVVMVISEAHCIPVSKPAICQK